MKYNVKGFSIYYDWIERLKDIEPDRAFAIICALSDYFKDGVNPLERFVGAERALLGIMFDQLKRAEQISAIRSQNGQLGGFAKANSSKSQQTLPNDTKVLANSGHNSNSNSNNIIEKEIYKEKETSKKTKKDGQSDEKKLSPIEERFNQFWSAYPKKVGKIYAFNCFSKLKPTAELTQKMIDAIAEQKKSVEWTKNKGEFIPNPSTWLNQGRWEDELIPASDAESNAPTSESVIPKYSNFDAEEAFQRAVERTYGKKD